MGNLPDRFSWDNGLSQAWGLLGILTCFLTILMERNKGRGSRD